MFYLGCVIKFWDQETLRVQEGTVIGVSRSGSGSKRLIYYDIACMGRVLHKAQINLWLNATTGKRAQMLYNLTDHEPLYAAAPETPVCGEAPLPRPAIQSEVTPGELALTMAAGETQENVFSVSVIATDAINAEEFARAMTGETQGNVFPTIDPYMKWNNDRFRFNPKPLESTPDDSDDIEYPPAQVAEDARQMARTKTALAAFTTDELIAEIQERTNRIAIERETLVEWANELDRNRWAIVDAVRREILRLVYPRAEVE